MPADDARYRRRSLEQHHNVRILDEGVAAAVNFRIAILPDRQLPDKAVSVLDTACARLALGPERHAAGDRGCHAPLDDLEVQARVLEREAPPGADHAERLEESRKRATVAETQCATRGAWEKERELVEEGT